MTASSPLKAEARWSQAYTRKRKAVEEEEVEWAFDEEEEECDDLENGHQPNERSEEIDGLQLLLTAIERKEFSAFRSQQPEQSSMETPIDESTPLDTEINPTEDEEAEDIIETDTPFIEQERQASAPMTPISLRHLSLPPSSPLSAPPTPRSSSPSEGDFEDDTKDLASPTLSRVASPIPPSPPLSRSSPREDFSATHIAVTVKEEEIANIPATSEPILSPPSPVQPPQDIPSPTKAASSQGVPKSPPKPQSDKDELTSELEGLIVTILAFGTKTSMTAPDIADAVITQSPQLLEKVSKSLPVLTESGANAEVGDKGKGKGKARAKPKQAGKGKRGRKSGKANDVEFQAMLSVVDVVLKVGRMFGRIDRAGEDAAGDALLPTFHYEPELDPDQDRAMTIQAAGVRTKRRATKHHVQYHWAPVSLNRFELAAECDDDD
ncbi:hypothetical protein FRB90_009818 [Tulasnella sp. 427]|nr:hypothetical protein FRB90_009818 [Tulasnella sp. 427]